MALKQTIKNLIYAAILLSIVVTTESAYIRRQDTPSQMLLDELQTVDNDENEHIFYNELQKLYNQHSSYPSKWPGLHEFLVPNDNDDKSLESEETAVSRFMKRLQHLVNLAQTHEDTENFLNDEQQLPLNKLSTETVANPKTNFKNHGTKKNAQFRKQYMSPCHFKICNMGRKRNARWYFAGY